MLETLIGLGIIASVYAYLYSKMPEENTSMRQLFLGLSLISIVTLAWMIYNAPNTPTSFEIITIGNTTTITPTPNSGTDGITMPFFYAQVIVLFLVLTLILLGLLKNAIPSAEQKTQKEIGGV